MLLLHLAFCCLLELLLISSLDIAEPLVNDFRTLIELRTNPLIVRLVVGGTPLISSVVMTQKMPNTLVLILAFCDVTSKVIPSPFSGLVDGRTSCQLALSPE